MSSLLTSNHIYYSSISILVYKTMPVGTDVFGHPPDLFCRIRKGSPYQSGPAQFLPTFSTRDSSRSRTSGFPPGRGVPDLSLHIPVNFLPFLSTLDPNRPLIPVFFSLMAVLSLMLFYHFYILLDVFLLVYKHSLSLPFCFRDDSTDRLLVRNNSVIIPQPRQFFTDN